MSHQTNSTEKKFIEELSPFGDVFPHASMAEFTTFACGGPADILLIPKDSEALASFLKYSAGIDAPVTIIGGGSNLLVGDKGITGIVAAVRETSAAALGRIEERGKGIVYADASVRKSRFVDFCIERSLEGSEFLAGIPGCIGGGIAMNAGTADGTFADILQTAYIASQRGGVLPLPADDLFAYRKFALPEGSVVTGGLFSLKQGNKTLLKQKVSETLAARKAKHPLEYHSAGSVFKNPTGGFAWKLINDAGLRGARIGGAMVSDKHTNFIVNTGHGTADDIRRLIELVQERVLAKFAVSLEPEVKFIGNF